MNKTRMQTVFSKDFHENVRLYNEALRVNESFDLVTRSFKVGHKDAQLYFIDGFIKDEMFEKMLEFLMQADSKALEEAETAKDFIRHFVTYVEANPVHDIHAAVTANLTGAIGMLIDGYDEMILVDARSYPARTTKEPDDDRVLRGSHDGFVETLNFNSALIRRRIRDPDLTMKIHQVGKSSKTDIVLCYMDSKVDKKTLKELEARLQKIEVGSLAFAQESLAELLMKKPQRLNPFPKTRYTERPDKAVANIMEGKIVILIDNSPSAMIYPCAFFEFISDSNDFYFPPLIGTYLRLVRMGIFMLTLFLTPLWYLLIKNPEMIPKSLEFIAVKEPNTVPIIAQLLIIEFIIDGLKLASLNTPSALNNSFSVVGALILGDFAVGANWFVPEVMLYMAFVAVATFTQPSFELGYAFKICRLLMLLLTALLNVWGFVLSIIIILLLLATTKTIAGKPYLYPVIPFDKEAFKHQFFRYSIRNSRN